MIPTPSRVSRRRLSRQIRKSEPRRPAGAFCEPLESRQLLSATIDVRLATTGGKAVAATAVGQTINMEVWATVTSADGDQTNDGFWEVFGSFLSAGVSAGSVKGTLAATTTSQFTSGPSSNGTQQDLDGDGDLDVGSNDPSTGADYFFARAGSVQYDGGTLTATTNAFRIAKLTFTVTSLGSGAASDINFSVRPTTAAAIWVEDGTPMNPGNGTLLSGSSVVVTGGNSTTGSIAGIVYNDKNGNGSEDDTEDGLSGVTVYLDANKNGTKDSGEVSTTTNASGAYGFAGLAAGTYTVRQVPPANNVQTAPASNAAQTVTLTSGQNVSAENFGDKSTLVTGSISGVIFNDANDNLAKDNGEAGVSGITVYIDSNNNGTLDSGEQKTTTDANGAYTLGSLAAGTYNVRQVVPTGDAQTTPANNAALSVTLADSQTLTGQNLGQMVIPINGAISGTVFSDANGNGTIDTGDIGVQGVTVFLDTNNNGLLDAGESNVVTSASGGYSFTGLVAGTYKIRQVLPTGYNQTAPASNAGFSATLSFSGTHTVTGDNFGDRSTTATITGTVFNDVNGNGTLDTGEPGIGGITLFIDANNNGGVDTGESTSVSDSSGSYSFTGLPTGTYLIREELPAGYTQTTPAGNTGISVSVTVGQTATGKNFGQEAIVAGTASIAGNVFNDANGNGTKDTGEAGLSGVTVYNDANNNSVLDAGEATTTTDTSGNYIFSGLAAGSYKIRQVLPGGSTQTAPAGNAAQTVTLTAGQVVTGKNFGDKSNTVVTGSISGTVFNDANGNGTKDTGEAGLSGRTLYNDANNNNILDTGEATTTSDSSGNYTFSGLAAGSYKIRQILPSGSTQTTPANNLGQTITLTAGQVVTGKNFGDKTTTVVTGSISGTVFNDANGNGTKDTGEAGLSGRTLYNDANNNNILDTGEATTTSDSSGNYTFSGLAAGSYKIRQILPSGSTQTTPANNLGQTITLTAGQVVTGKNFGDKTTTVVTGSISGTVFNDANGNGTKDTGETGLSGRTVYNDANNNSKLDTGEATTTTDASGNYTFSGLAAGSYKIRQVLPAGSTQTSPSGGLGQTITLTAGQIVTGKNFGDKTTVAVTGSIAGIVFNDLNANGTQNTGEAGLNGWKVYIDTNNNSVLDSNEVFVTTSSTGAYTFTGLAAGTYKIRVVRPTGWTQTSPTNNFGQTVTITAAQAATGESFGEKQ